MLFCKKICKPTVIYIIARNSAVAVIADHTAVRSAKKLIRLGLLRDFCFNAIHCDRIFSTCV